MDWAKALDPKNGGPGESPGYQETLADIRANPPAPRPKKKGKRKR